MSNETIQDRIFSRIGKGKMSEIARNCGISESTLRSYRKSMPAADMLVKLADGLGVDLKWLATGEGSPTPGESVETGDSVLVPLLDVRASAGAGAHSDSETATKMMAFPREFLRSAGVNPYNARILTVSGDSMEPTLSSGDLLLVDVSVKRIRNEALYVLVRDDDVYVKRAQKRLQGSILIKSDNERYPPEEFSEADADRLRVAGRVAWYGRSI